MRRKNIQDALAGKTQWPIKGSCEAMAVAVALAVSGSLLACAPPIQNGGVDVIPGAAERLTFACRRMSSAAGCYDPKAERPGGPDAGDSSAQAESIDAGADAAP
jgi:hypothetical protein